MESLCPARKLRCTRLRGVMRHYWINDGVESIPGAPVILWSTDVESANALRAELGLALLNPELDPAPDLSTPPAQAETPSHRRATEVITTSLPALRRSSLHS